MKNLFLFLALLILSCEKTGENKPTPIKVPPASISIVDEPKTANSGTAAAVGLEINQFKTRIVAKNYTEKQAQKVFKAQEIIGKIFRSARFKQEVLSRKYTSTKLSAEQIYKTLIDGDEKRSPGPDQEMDLQIQMYRANNSTVGWTKGSIDLVHTNSKFYDKYSACRVASNITHEWSHKLGFDHASAKDSKSVPYSLNDIIETLCPSYL